MASASFPNADTLIHPEFPAKISDEGTKLLPLLVFGVLLVFSWATIAIRKLGLEITTRPRGRPKLK